LGTFSSSCFNGYRSFIHAPSQNPCGEWRCCVLPLLVVRRPRTDVLLEVSPSPRSALSVNASSPGELCRIFRPVQLLNRNITPPFLIFPFTTVPPRIFSFHAGVLPFPLTFSPLKRNRSSVNDVPFNVSCPARPLGFHRRLPFFSGFFFKDVFSRTLITESTPLKIEHCLYSIAALPYPPLSPLQDRTFSSLRLVPSYPS